MRQISAILLLLWCALAQAAGPRYVTGQPYFTGQAGRAIGWKQPLLLYSTDPADLSPYVNHAAADALVAAAAGVWNVPVASITVGKGPALAEHVSGQNVYFGANGLQFPADVMSSNAAQIPLAVLYDTDGSVTDTLLGAGASSPSGCRQNGVTESVDAFDPAGYIQHAIIVINGRCTGAAPAAQLQLQYQLMRVFGRVLGLAWSQTNDNVFTGSPTPTPVQAQNWPIMHPLDIICGLYTYQCLPNPFTLRIDDIGGLVAVYPNRDGSALAAGKQSSYAAAQGLGGDVYFPTGEGMSGVNVLVRRQAPSTNTAEGFFAASGVTGTYALRGRTSSFVAADTSPLGSEGDGDPSQEGRFLVPWFPMLGTVGWDDRVTTTEPINPLYTGEYSLGAYPAGNVAPSGSPLSQTIYIVFAGLADVEFTASDAAVACGTGADGTPTAPMQAPASGWWNGTTCGYRHVSYINANVQPGRTFTIETTALDAQGLPTETKLMPVLGLFAPNDYPPYTVPTLGATVTAFNGLTTGTTTLHAGTGTATSIRFGIGDQRGDGRPDFSYQARLFYADSVAPAQVAATGGTLTITGTGFRTGNAVTVNGVAANVLSWSATSLVVTVPGASAAGATAGSAVDVTVSDRGTGATSTITAAVTYQGNKQPKSMRVLSAPSGTLLMNDLAPVPFSVQLIAADGVTPVPNTAVQFTVTAGAATFAACAGAATCQLITDANGTVSTQVTPQSQYAIVLQAAVGALSQTATLNGLVQASSMLVTQTPENPLHVNIKSSNPFAIRDVGANGTTGLGSRSVTFTVTSGAAILSPCFASPCTVVTDGSGNAEVYVTPTSAGPIVVQARDGDVSQTVTVNALANTDIMVVTNAPPAQVYPGDGPVIAIKLYHSDGTPDPYEPITLTASPGVIFDVCPNLTCPVSTDYSGHAAATVHSLAAGIYTIQIGFGSVVQTVTLTVVAHQYFLKVLSAPPNNSATGKVAAQPFTVQVVSDDGVSPAPIYGRSVILGGATGAVSMTNCQYSACEIFVDGNSTATAWIIPQQPGTITLSAVFAPLVTTVDFTAVGGARTMQIVNQPGSEGVPTNVAAHLAVQVFQPDGVTPMSDDQVYWSVLSGPFAFYLGTATKEYTTGGDGMALIDGFPTGYGPVVVQATDGVVTRLISFIAGTPPYVLKLLSNAPSPSTTGTATATPFAVQVFAQDGVTPAPNQPVTFSLTSGAATLNGCPATACVLTTNAQGVVSLFVTPTAAGIVGLLAADGLATLATSFVAAAPPDLLRVTSAPANGSYVGLVAAGPFTVQALLADGVTPAAGRSVQLSVTSGSATLAACKGAPTCTLVTDASGNLSTTVTPTAAGSVTLQAIDGTSQASTTFTAAQRPDTIHLLSAPTGAVGVGYPASAPFTIQILQGDGTPEPGKTVIFSATTGSVRLGCGTSTCSVTTTADGTATATVTPLAAGPVTLVATEATLIQTATFTATTQPDLLRITSTPASGGYPGVQAAGPFAVQALLADGVTPATARSITLSVTTGAATFAACNGASTCILVTDASGTIATIVTPTTTGNITLQAVDGQTTATTSFTTIARPDTIHLLSAPTGTVGVGYPASAPFTIQILQGDGITPEPGKTVVFSATTGSVRFGCGSATCSVTTAADGTATTTVTPLAAGPVTLVATEATLIQTATFTATTQPDLLRITSTPASGGYPGMQANGTFAVQALLADGVTPATARSITLSVTTGAATFAACNGASTCTLVTDANGTLSTTVTPVTAGTITLVATDGPASISTTFSTVALPDTLTLVSAPSSPTNVGSAATIPFAVRLLQGDRITPRAGATITFAVTPGTASFGACPTSPCTLVTDATGTALATVTPLVSGTITLTATAGMLQVSATFLATQQPQEQDALTTASPTLYLAEGATTEVILSASATRNGFPAAGQTVQWSGQPLLQPASAATVTSATGSTAIAAHAGPLAPGAQAQATACAWTSDCVTFTATGVSATQFQPIILAGGSQSASTLQSVTLSINDTAGHTIAGAPVTIYQTVSAYPVTCPAQGRGPTAPVLASLVTVITSDATGRYTFQPLTVDGLATQTEIAIATGTSGFTTTTLTRQP